MMKNIKLVFAVIAIVLVLIIIFQNTQQVETRLLFFTFSMPNAVLIAVTFAIGLVVGWLLAITARWKKKSK